MTEADVRLYSTAGCHLCEEAKALLQASGSGYVVVDIASDAELMERYGIRIPVLQRPDNGAELGWPFDANGLAAFLKQS